MISRRQSVSQHDPSIPSTKSKRKALLRRFPRLLSTVSQRHRFDSGLVSRVFHGRRTARRIEKAILAELARRIENEANE